MKKWCWQFEEPFVCRMRQWMLWDMRVRGNTTNRANVLHESAIDRLASHCVSHHRHMSNHSHLACYSNIVPFRGGQAHAGIAYMTQRLWNLVERDVMQALDENEGYEFILTGHSLGAGTCLLLNVMLHQDARFQKRPFRTFAFAAPPVYYSPRIRKAVVQTAVNYIHDMDDVPLLSGYSLRRQVAVLTAIDDECKDMDLVQKAKLILGQEAPSEALLKAANDAFDTELVPKEGMPVLMSPAMAIAWACQVPSDEKKQSFDLKLCDSSKLAASGIYMDSQSVLDHYPTMYEKVFTNIN